MEAASNIKTCYYRSGYDVSIPLPPRHEATLELASLPPDERRFFLTIQVMSGAELIQTTNDMAL